MCCGFVDSHRIAIGPRHVQALNATEPSGEPRLPISRFRMVAHLRRLGDRRRYPTDEMTQTFQKDNRHGKLAIAVFGSVFTLLCLFLSGIWPGEPVLAFAIFVLFFIGGWIQLAYCYAWPVVWNVTLDHTSLSYFCNGSLVQRVNKSEVSEIVFSRLDGWSPSNFEAFPTIKLTLKGGGVHTVSHWRLSWKHRQMLLSAFASFWGESMLQRDLVDALSADMADNRRFHE